MAGEIFISYRRSDLAQAKRLHDLLKAEGIEAWYDAQVGAGQDWRAATAAALSKARIFVLLFSKAASESEDISKELAAATFSKKLVIPVRLEDIQPEGPFLYELASRNWVNAYDDTGVRLAELSRSLAALVKSGSSDASGLPFDRDGDGSPKKTDWRKLAPIGVAAVALLAILAAGIAIFSPKDGVKKVVQTEARVAVLPFDLLNDGQEAKHYAEGLTDEIVTELSSNRIQVVSRDDAVLLRGPDKAKTVAELGVALTFDGTVQHDGKAINVRVHLDDPIRHATLWSGDVEGPASDGAQLQSKLANRVASILACSNRALIPQHGLTEPSLLARYLRACDIFTSVTYDERKIYDLLGALREVTAGAPDFVAAHSDLAKFAAYFSPIVPPDQGDALRKEAAAEAETALKLDPKSPDGFLAKQMLQPQTNWAERESLLRQGLAGDPAWPHTNGFLGQLLADVGRVKEGVTYTQRAAAARLQIDWGPFAAAVQAGAGEFQPSISFLQNRLAAGAYNEPEIRLWLFNALKQAARWNEARAMLEGPEGHDILGYDANLAFLKAMTTHAPADIAKVRAIVQTAPPGPNLQKVREIEMLSSLGLVDEAFKAADTYEPGMPESGALSEFLFFPMTAAMRRDPRFIKLAARWKLVDYWRSSGHWPDFCSEPGLPYNCEQEAARVAPK